MTFVASDSTVRCPKHGIEVEHDAACAKCVWESTVHIGDRMRFSTELLKQIDEMPDRQSEVVKLVEVRVEHDGSKTLMLQRVEASV